jgi:hypothetical protein
MCWVRSMFSWHRIMSSSADIWIRQLNSESRKIQKVLGHLKNCKAFQERLWSHGIAEGWSSSSARRRMKGTEIERQHTRWWWVVSFTFHSFYPMRRATWDSTLKRALATFLNIVTSPLFSTLSQLIRYHVTPTVEIASLIKVRINVFRIFITSLLFTVRSC